MRGGKMRGGPVALGVVAIALRRGRRAAGGQAQERVVKPAPDPIRGEVAGLPELGDLGDAAERVIAVGEAREVDASEVPPR